MNGQVLADFLQAISFGYPFVMAYYWIAGGLIYHWVRGRYEPRFENPTILADYPPVSILVPCHNEEQQLEETISVLAKIDYSDFEIVAINDGSTDRTAEILDTFAQKIPYLRVIHLAGNQGKSTALNIGALWSRHELLVCTDGDALLDRNSLKWFVRRFQSDVRIGGLTGNPRIRNRASLLGRLQVGEFSSIIGLIKRAQTVIGTLFTVSGVMCAFRKRALHEAGWWNANALTDDVELSCRLQLAGWYIAYEPKAICWILMPETVSGLWRQRLRWAVGGTQTVLQHTRAIFRERHWRLFPIWFNYVISTIWAYVVVIGTVFWSLSVMGMRLPSWAPVFQPLPETWGIVLAATYLLQAITSFLLDSRFERRSLSFIFWIVWYPLLFWSLQVLTTVVALPYALLRSKERRGTWVSPDRGIR
jgi:biofilm PGA synthesis N-glycosyltransferase PgaC